MSPAVGPVDDLPTSGEVYCSCDPELFTDPAWELAAARACAVCPLADACLQRALRINAAYTHGRDPYGICGVCGGVWFEPGRMPRHVLTESQKLHDRHLWAAA